jgi:hypothetical protein
MQRMRTFFKRFFALLKLMSILVNALQHLPKGVTARQMPERTTRVSGQRMALHSARIMTQLLQRTGTLRGRRGFPDCQLASSLSHSQENLSCLRHRRSNQMFQGCQHTEELTVVRIIGCDGAIPMIGTQSRKSRSAGLIMRDRSLPVRQNHEFLILVDGWIRKGAFRCGIIFRHCFLII